MTVDGPISYYLNVPTMVCQDSCVPLIHAILSRADWIDSVEVEFQGKGGWVRAFVSNNNFNAQSIIDLISTKTRGVHSAVVADDPNVEKGTKSRRRFGK